MQLKFKWALVDIKTTGLHIIHDKIIDIAIIILTEKGIEATWHSLTNPERAIPEQIQQLTGINNTLLSTAPTFKTIADELILLLQGCILVADNVRFDYSFLKNAFKSEGIHFQLPILCTIKLFRELELNLKQDKLLFSAQRLAVKTDPIQRTQNEVRRLQKLITQAVNDFSLLDVLTIAKKIYQRSSAPENLVTDLDTIPESPGVYLFYGDERTLPLYIGKSVSMRQRVLSHFQVAHSQPKEFTLSQQVKYIDIIPTAGELSALLLESALIKEKMPLYNRRLRKKKNLVTITAIQSKGYLTLTAMRERVDGENESVMKNSYGAFRSLSAAKEKLLYLVKEFNLCPKLCGLEQTKHACFAYQLKKCRGACIQLEAYNLYNQRANDALKQFKREDWPFKGAIAIKEENSINAMTQYSVFHQWRHIGTINNEQDLASLRHQTKQTVDSYNTYKILSAFLKSEKKKINLVELHDE